MNITKDAISFRRATNLDETYVNELTRRTMIDYVSKTWTDPSEIENYFKKNAYDSTISTWIIVFNGRQPVGRLSIRKGVTDLGKTILVLDNIHIEPIFHGKGIGRLAIEELALKDGEKHGWPVCLLVLKTNPARALYERLGFRIVGESSTRYYMGWNVPIDFGWSGGIAFTP